MEKLQSVSLRMQRVWVPEGAVVHQLPTRSNQTLILAGKSRIAADADEVYTLAWARIIAAVTKLLPD